MAIIRNAANQLSRGRSGQSTYYVANGRQIMRPALNNSNYGESARRSAAQQLRRVKWANLVNLYKVSSSWMPKAFESKKKGQTDYNKFMQVNVNNASIALTRDEALNGAIVVAPVQLTQGSLTSISMTKQGTAWVSNLAVGQAFAFNANTTIGQLTAALTANTPFVVEGMQLSFVQYLQNVDANNIPHATCVFYEVTLDSTSTDFVADFLPEDALNVINGFIATTTDVDLGGFAYILSQKTPTGLKVSSQQMIVNNETLVAKYTGSAQVNKAIDSYGLDTEVILNPESISGAGGVVAPQYISAMTLNGESISAGSYIAGNSGLPNVALVITMANRIKSSAVSVVLSDNAGHEVTISDATISGKQITASGHIGGMDGTLVRIAVIGEEDEYGWDFAATPAPVAQSTLTLRCDASEIFSLEPLPVVKVNNVAATRTSSGEDLVYTAQVPTGQSATVAVECDDSVMSFMGWQDGGSSNPRNVVVTQDTELRFAVVSNA